MIQDHKSDPGETHERPPPDRSRGRFGSKVLVIGLFAWIIGFGVFSLWKSTTPPAGAEIVESPFKPWDGVWEGEFVTYDYDGTPVQRLHVRQSYRHVNAKKKFRQEGEIENTDLESGEKTREIVIHTANFDRTGLRGRVLRKNGRQVIERTGRLEDGYLFWSRSKPGTVETYRQWIEGDVYHVEGTGLYGDPATAKPMRFVGRYRRIEEEPSEQE